MEWDCPRCFWKLPAVDKEFWHRCFAAKAGGEGIRVQLLSNTELFPFKPAAYCHREHYSVLLHKKQPASVYVFEQPQVEAAPEPKPCPYPYPYPYPYPCPSPCPCPCPCPSPSP